MSKAKRNISKKLEAKYGILMTPNDVAEVRHQHPTHVRALCKDGQLPAIKIGQRWHVITAKFAAMLDNPEYGGDAQ